MTFIASYFSAAPRIEEENVGGDRFGRRDDFLSSRPDRHHAPSREDVPLPTQPPYTAFVGNLAFDLTESELEQFFNGIKTKSVKIIKDREEKPKGFGYVEFEELSGLKEALSKNGSSFSGRNIRVSVAEPPKERTGFGGPSEDSSKFDNPWRREGPLSDLPKSRDSSRRRFDGPSGDRQPSSVSDNFNDWRSNMPQRSQHADAPSFKRKGSGFLASDGQGSADKEETWSIGSKFRPSTNGLGEDTTIKPGFQRPRGDMGPPRESPADEGDWRSSARPPKTVSRSSISPSSSTPPTPQLARKKLELLPRSGSGSVSPSPLSSPKMAPSQPSAAKPSPFGEARPVDVSAREKEVAERLQREREATQGKLSMSRSSSRSGVDRSAVGRPQTPPSSSVNAPSKSPAKSVGPSLAPSVRPSLSFANVAAKREAVSRKAEDIEATVEQVADEVAKSTL
ncbi:hypothetical protein CVT26_013149 [Gymnopilus dilepis]|uniref:RRM domain-containing protein n=1 Tax=Gymnopilus dilepis TaxID=231916 RepID=A0A409WUX9_9AGAR|nr:hypothetical protein CVT26_013149 [Gymnopilus dilepis]